MKKQLDGVKLFHEAFKIPYKDKPTLIEDHEATLRYELMKEENEEYLDACMKDDLTEVADALGDKLYILCGTILSHGMQHIIEDVFDEISKSNMSKLDRDGKPIINGEVFTDVSKPLGKVLKGPDFVKPDIAKFL